MTMRRFLLTVLVLASCAAPAFAQVDFKRGMGVSQKLRLNTPTFGNGNYQVITCPDALGSSITDYACLQAFATPATVAAGSVGSVFRSIMTNSSATVGGAGHLIGGLFDCTDTTLGQVTCYGAEGRVDGRSTVGGATHSYVGVTGQGHFQGSSLAAGVNVIGVDSTTDITTDGSTPLASGSAIAFRAAAIVGGATKYAFLGSNTIRTTSGGIEASGAGISSTLVGGSDTGLSTAAGNFATCIGDANTCAAAGAVALGYGTNIGASFTGSMGFGLVATPTAANQAVFGSSTANSAWISDVYFGSGVSDATPKSVTYHGTNARAGTDTNTAGANVTITPGAGTGTGAGSQVAVNRDLVGSTGTAAQAQAPAFVACETKTLSNTSATTTTLATIGLASNTAGGAWGQITVVASDGTNFDVETQDVNLSFVNKAGTFTVSTPTITASSAASNSGSTTIGFTATGASSLISLKVTPVFTTIVPTSVTAYLTLINNSAGAVVCQ